LAASTAAIQRRAEADRGSEQVAASGGYMMCCVWTGSLPVPCGLLGSIGVIPDIPVVYERSKKEGIEFQTVTVGKYKRTPFHQKKQTKEDLVYDDGRCEAYLLFCFW
jgi:ClpP class serine protease